ncbi:MAG TPA: dynamin family protein [Candidatus Scybalomonas excrementigallinarum]|nr:dynamin family protein [Candidatus Scybalomonas excrementigallinarum]
MINKKKVEEKIGIASEIATKYSLSNIKREMEYLANINRDYKINILMIGGFSVGKSALLNKLIGKEVLKENIKPETALATELHFSEKERIIANYFNGVRKEVDDINTIDIDKVRNLEYYLSSENLKCQPDYVFVDTPGFDSGIEKHNKALMQYVDRGTVFFLVVDCERGTISESALNFMNEVSNYSGDIAVILNKCDKKIEEEVIEIKEHIEELLLATCGREFPVIYTSIKDKDVDKKILELVKIFEPQYLYEKNMKALIDNKCIAICEALELLKEKKDFDLSDLDEEINRREDIKRRLLDQIEIQKKRMRTKIHSDVKEKIISSIQIQLVSNVHLLANAYKGGIETFQKQVIEIIRPILINEVENYSSIAYEDFVRNLSLESDNSNRFDDINDIVVSVYNKIKSIGESKNLLLTSDKDNELLEKGTGIYKSITSILAIAVTNINPIIELVIVFLPDIIKLLNVFTGSSKEQELMEAIQNRIIPQIVAKIRTELEYSLTQIEDVMVGNISTSIDEIIEVENEALENVKNKKSVALEEYEKYISEITEDIERLRR